MTPRARSRIGRRARGMIDGSVQLTAEMVVDGLTARQPVISPDGRWVAYIVRPVGQPAGPPRSAIWLAAADASVPPRALTPATAAASAPVWAPDSASVYFLSADAASSADAGLAQLQ